MQLGLPTGVTAVNEYYGGGGGGGGGRAGLCGPGWRTRPQKGINKLRSLSFWKAGLHFRALERESGPDSAGFICCWVSITPSSLAMPTGSLCYVD